MYGYAAQGCIWWDSILESHTLESGMLPPDHCDLPMIIRIIVTARKTHAPGSGDTTASSANDRMPSPATIGVDVAGGLDACGTGGPGRAAGCGTDA